MESENPYLALRKAKIARNEDRLRQLGLLNTSSKPSIEPEATGFVSAIPKATRSSSVVKASKPSVPLRRSSRLSNQPQPPVTEKTLEEEPRTYTPPPKRPRTSNTTETKPPAFNSVRGISLDIVELLTASESLDPPGVLGVLGVPMEQTGKRFVVEESFRRAAVDKDRERLLPDPDAAVTLSFNKFSGVQEWSNCAFLWVNLGGRDDDHPNQFLHDGRQITWFGGSRMVDDSPVIQRLLEWGKRAHSSSSQILLWCRTNEQKGMSPYTCLGRLAYHSHEPGSHPLAFVWTLLDFDLLQQLPNKSDRDAFQRMISISRS